MIQMSTTHAERWGQKPLPSLRRRSRKAAARRAPGTVRNAAVGGAGDPGAGAAEAPKQLSFADARTRGGRRVGAGRKKGLRPKMLHLPRPALSGGCPVHVTLRRAKELPSVREQVLFGLVKRAIADSGREDFRILEYSVQSDHVHLVIEAADAAALTRGMRGFSVRVAMRVNRRVRHRARGRVWADRYHRRDLPTPTEVRWALVYVFSNHLKHGHGEAVGLLDPFSSGAWFSGWMHVGWPPPTAAPVTQAARTWMMNEGWWRHGGGFIHLGERPAAARHADVVALRNVGFE